MSYPMMRGWMLLEVMIGVFLIALGVGALLKYQQNALKQELRQTQVQQAWQQGEQALILYQMGLPLSSITQLLALPPHWSLDIDDARVNGCHKITVRLLAPAGGDATLARVICSADKK